jgi:hypothetical protein
VGIDGSPKEFGLKECSGGWGRIDRVKSLALRNSVLLPRCSVYGLLPIRLRPPSFHVL